MNSAGRTVADDKKKKQTNKKTTKTNKQTNKNRARHCCFGQRGLDERCPEKYTAIAFFLLPESKGTLEDCKARIRARGRLHDQIVDQHTWSALARPLQG